MRKTIKGFPKYEITDTGEVYTKSSGKRKATWIISGYEMLCLYKDGKRTDISVHRLVALNFIPNEEDKPIVNHKDLNKLNNHASNLEWVTHQENIDHAWDLLREKRKEKADPKAKLTNEQVREIKKRLLKGEKGSVLAREYNVVPSNIYSIKSGNTWRHIKIEEDGR